jgi:hypothetical protein
MKRRYFEENNSFHALIESYLNFNNIFQLRNNRIKNALNVLMISKFKLTVNLIALLSSNNWMFEILNMRKLKSIKYC